MKRLTLLILSIIASQANSLEFDPSFPVERSQALGSKEVFSTPSQIPARPFLDEEAEDLFKTEGKKAESYGFEMIRLGRGSNAFFYRNGWGCLNDRAVKNFICYGRDAAYDDRIWLFATSYSQRALSQKTKAKTFGTLYQVDCGYQAVRSLRDYASDDHFGKGNTQRSRPEASEGEWHFPKRSSAKAHMANVVCKGASLIPEAMINGSMLLIQNNIFVNNTSK